VFVALLKLCCTFCVGFAALLGVLHSQQRDDADLRAFIRFPERCETACFMGLRPGYTRIDTAIRALERNGWVSEVRNGVSQASGSGEVSWGWGENAPAVINTAYPGRLRASDGLVTAIIVEMRAPAGAWRLALDADPPQAAQAGWNVTLRAADCTGNRFSDWQAPARLQLSSAAQGDLPLLSCSA
jgi:hypothetical protein